MDQYKFKVRGEHFLPIRMNLMAMPGQNLEDLTEVASHPMALLQCRGFFDQQRQLRLVEDTDTAAVAKRIAQEQLKGVAAVAGDVAAELYGLEILAADIHSMKSNTTRFLILEREDGEEISGADKASLKMELNHKPGSLSRVLAVIHAGGLDLTKIQSLPIPDVPWKYAFFMDILFGSFQKLEMALQALEEHTEKIELMGIYKNRL